MVDFFYLKLDIMFKLRYYCYIPHGGDIDKKEQNERKKKY